jgi:hypothetical protein
MAGCENSPHRCRYGHLKGKSVWPSAAALEFEDWTRRVMVSLRLNAKFVV